MIYVIVATGTQPVNAACPNKIEGNNDTAELRIEYYGSKYCPYCWKQEPIFEKITNEYGDKVVVEHYDVKSCGEGVLKWGVAGTPTMVFLHKGTEQVVRGFIDEIQFRQILCEKLNICS